ncbi:unnamed protein product [Allacma fusca]|uniref:Uncharacterized protein n=1 Tax=Allacma fusca TaxID=39272 RepID=A0A8J2JUH3_9HEXA|nr:unnamed protein product [Allacma fusca]
MDRDEDIYAAAERQLTLLEEKLNAAEGGLFSVKNVLTTTKSNLSTLDCITKEARIKKNFRVEGSALQVSNGDFTSGLANQQETDVARDIQEVLEKQFCPTELVVEVVGSFGGRAKVDIVIVSEQFERVGLNKRHKLIEAAVKSIFNYENRIHSVEISRALDSSQYKARVA